MPQTKMENSSLVYLTAVATPSLPPNSNDIAGSKLDNSVAATNLMEVKNVVFVVVVTPSPVVLLCPCPLPPFHRPPHPPPTDPPPPCSLIIHPPVDLPSNPPHISFVPSSSSSSTPPRTHCFLLNQNMARRLSNILRNPPDIPFHDYNYHRIVILGKFSKP